MRIYLEVEIRRVKCQRCGKVKQEKLDWISDNPFYTKRFAFLVGRRCRNSTIQDAAKEYRLNWRTIKELDKQYMREQLKRFGTPAPRIIGLDEIAIKKGHKYRIVVSDLIRRRAIWFGGRDRSEQSMDMFYKWLGPKKSKKVQLAVMDMWKAFKKSAENNISHADILYDKFHIMKHLCEALDKVRKLEYARLSGESRDYIKGQKYTLLSRKKNLTLKGRRSLKKLLAADALTKPICLRNHSHNYGTMKKEAGLCGFLTIGRMRLSGND